MSEKLGIGIDVSISHLGVCVGTKNEITFASRISYRGNRSDPSCIKIIRVCSVLEELIDKYQPDIAAIEGYAFHMGASGWVYQIGGAGERVRGMLYERKIPYLEIYPSTLKKRFSGYGRAKKLDMIKAVQEKYGLITRDDDVADAIALLWCLFNEHKPTEKKRRTWMTRAEISEYIKNLDDTHSQSKCKTCGLIISQRFSFCSRPCMIAFRNRSQ